MKVVINACFGGFAISLDAARHMAAAGSPAAKQEVEKYEKQLLDFKHYKATGEKPSDDESGFLSGMWDINIKYDSLPKFHGYGPGGGYSRNDPLLVDAVEALGSASNGEHAKLKVVEIPDGTDYEISEYDGNEHVAEKHRTWN